MINIILSYLFTQKYKTHYSNILSLADKSQLNILYKKYYSNYSIYSIYSYCLIDYFSYLTDKRGSLTFYEKILHN